MKKQLLLIAPLLAMALIAFIAVKRSTPSVCVGNRGIAALGSVKYSVFLAVTPAEWELGLSGRSALPRDEGMLFLFPNPRVRAFWMKDMHFPIDIVWIDQDWRVIGIEKGATPASYPSTFTSPSPVRRVLEIAATEGADSRVHVGDYVQFNCL